MFKFPSINQFHSVVKYHASSATGSTYRAKIKLHGTNAGIHINPQGELSAQSRNRVLSLQNDNAGFATWVRDNNEYFSSLAIEEHVIIYGEWCGPGILRGTAIQNIEHKVFCIFALQWGKDEETSCMIVDPEDIAKYLRDIPSDVYILPWFKDQVEIDFTDPDHMQKQLDIINKWVKEIDEQDPWVKATFNIKGCGEGLVFVPISRDFTTRWDYSKHAFKVKGEKHNVVKQNMPAQVNAEVAASLASFAVNTATIQRFEQMISDNALTFDMENTGAFLKAVNQDIHKECQAELEASGLEWKQAAKAVSTRAVNWFKAQVQGFR